MERNSFVITAPAVVDSLEWYVFPVCWATPEGKCGCGQGHTGKAIGKAPLTPKGHLDASRNPKQIETWAKKWSQANIGVALAKSGVGVVDCDSDGAIFEADELGTPETAIVKTASGQHRYYSIPTGYPVTRITKRGESGMIDVLTDGFAILPGSRHRNGHIYEWLVAPSDLDELPPLPQVYVDWLESAIESRQSDASNDPVEPVYIDAPTKLSSYGMALWTGEKFVSQADDEAKIDRSETMYALAGQLVEAGLDEDSAAGALAGWDALHGQKYTGRKDASKRYRQTILRAMESGGHELLLDDPDNAADKAPKKKKGVLSEPSESVWRDLYLEKYPHTAFGRGEFRRYKTGIWEIIPETQIGRELALLMGGYTTAKLVGAVRTLVKDWSAVKDDRWDANPNILVLGNGTLDLEAFSLREHRPTDYATVGVLYNYDPGANCPSWMRYINTEWFDSGRKVCLYNHTVGDDVRAFLQEFAGYSLTQDTKYEIALWLVSPMGRGKSTFQAGLQAMLGPRCGELSLRAMNNQFGLDNMPGKTLMMASEQPSGYMECLDIFNKMVSGEPIRIEKKFKDSFEIRPIVKLCWAMNDAPRIAEPNNGIWRRIQIVEQPEMPDDLKDADLKDAILLEGPGILNWALEGLKRLRARNRWRQDDIPSSIKRAVSDFKALSDIPGTFIDEECTRSIGALVGRQKLYNRYSEWCQQNGHKPKARRFVAQDWRRLGLIETSSRGKDYWRGIILKDRVTEEEAPVVEEAMEIVGKVK